MPINVFLTDDQNLVRQGIKSLLENQCEVTVVGEANNGYECLNEVNKLNPNIVIIDVNMSGLDGIKTLQIMKEQNFNVRTIMLADTDDADDLVKAVNLGCDGYLLKSIDVSILKKAVFKVYNGERYIQQDLETLLENSIQSKSTATDKLNELTKREIDVLKLLAEGLFNKEIAAKLDISERTVKNHVSNIFKKIRVNDRTQAAVFAIKHSLISL